MNVCSGFLSFEGGVRFTNYISPSTGFVSADPITYLSVSDATQQIRGVLERTFPVFHIEAEISEYKVYPTSGHAYFTIKDAQAQLQCVMWKGVVSRLSFAPKAGMKVLIQGKPDLYAPQGKFQISVMSMFPSGEGLLQKKFLELKAKLEREGLFAPDRKRPIPFFPRAIGIVSSAQGAVIRDIMVRVRERLPSLQVYLVDVRVQGKGAAEEIASGVELLNQLGKVDTIIVARGGGSLEDLWSFNEEVVVRAVFASRIPIISGVGHEVDFTLCDFVADLRAPTPTAAAEMAVPKRADLLVELRRAERVLAATDRWFQPLVQNLDDLQSRLDRGIDSHFTRQRLMVEKTALRLQGIEPSALLSHYRRDVDHAFERLSVRVERILHSGEREVQKLSASLEALSPTRVLDRGYSLVEKDGALVRDASSLSAGDSVRLRFARGRAAAQIVGSSLE